jgi:diguanylate cyclase (GGDEF)-like protein
VTGDHRKGPAQRGLIDRNRMLSAMGIDGDKVRPPQQERPPQEPARAPQGPALDTSRILASIGEAAYDWDLRTDILTWSANVGAVLGVTDAAALASGRQYARLLDPASQHTRFDTVARSQERDEGKGVPFQIEYGLDVAPETKLWVEDIGRWFAGPDGQPARAHGVIRVINARHEQEERLAYLSQYDGLTGEMNRWRLTEVLGKVLDDAIRFQRSCAFLLVAVDNLARINECYGFEIADEVIAEVAKRIRADLRGVDSLGRFSGNKFGVVLTNCTPEDMAVAADRLLAAVRDEVVQTSAAPVAITATIGGVAAPRHARTVDEILARAQESLDAAKAKRRGSFFAYRPSVEREAMRRENARATDEIVTALNERRILLAYEPVVEARSRKPVFYECLMRIMRGDGTLLGAGDIIPVAERLGLVRLIDFRVVDLVMAELLAAPDLKVSLNVSPASTLDPDWWGSFAAQLRSHPSAAERIVIEITEMAAFQNVDDAAGFVTRAKDLGCHVAIDDFGAGNTSFRNLRRLGVDIVKIDGSFVQNLARSTDDRLFVRTIVELAKGLGLATVAEWVQDEESAAMLTEWGCDYFQGFLVGEASVERPYAVEDGASAGTTAA